MLASPTSNTWSQVRVRTRPANNVRVEFRFFPDYARTAWTRTQDRTPTFVRRGPVSYPPETLLLDDVILIDNQSAFVRAWLIEADKPGFYHLRVELAAPTRMAQNAHVSLRWDNHEYPGVMRAGQLFFENISPPNFSRYLNNLPTRSLHLAVEFEQTKKKAHAELPKNGNGKH